LSLSLAIPCLASSNVIIFYLPPTVAQNNSSL
jgi:hypothetical protein